MWNLGDTEDDKKLKLVKVVQKWLEFKADEYNELDETTVQLAYNSSISKAGAIVDRLEIKDPREVAYLTTWVQIAYFAGFLTGWQDHRELLKIRPQHASWATDLEGFTREDWALPYATTYARKATDNLFEHLYAPPVSVLVSNLAEVHLAFLKETHERSLFAGYLEGLEQAFKIKGHNLSTITIDNTYEV